MVKPEDDVNGGPCKKQFHIFVRRFQEEASEEAAVMLRLGFRVSPPVHYDTLSCDAWGKLLPLTEGAWIVIAEA